jgi:predicted ATP-binding protein involved in virulence
MGEIKTSEENKDDVFITDLVIHKVRHLEDIHIPLSKEERKHLILTGKNGSGKTSVLECLKGSIRATFGSVNLTIGKEGFKPDLSALDKVSVALNSSTKTEDFHDAGQIILAFYAAKRLTNMKIPKGLERLKLKTFYNIEEQPSRDFIQYIVNLKAEKSFARDENDHTAVKNIEKWFDTLENSLKEIFEDPSLKLEFDRKNYNFKIIQEGKEPFDFNTLADGYSAIINVVTDLILRMEKNKTKGFDVQGMVLIDELEAHLHIDLQKKIFPFLTRFFPKIQFIVTTHSPFILNSIKNVVIYDLEKHLLVSDLSAYSYDGIVEGYFDNDKYSQEIKEKIETYEQLVRKKKRTEEEDEKMMDLRMYLKEIAGPLASELKARFQQIELNRVGKTNG